ncbi:MAG: hypothetical protein H6510_02470 [Acidobacteria bacterium]|nr:hypothetical protein [Acidobacteriota bacterium]MCB9396659.1 hypothetical protein [Acidobacteriota bacterium]
MFAFDEAVWENSSKLSLQPNGKGGPHKKPVHLASVWTKSQIWVIIWCMTVMKTVLINLSFLVEVPAEIADCDEFSDLDRLDFALHEIPESILSGFKVEWVSSRRMVLDPKTMNASKCETCGRWVTNRESPRPLNELNIGAIFQGKLLCDECLPKGHRWAF